MDKQPHILATKQDVSERVIVCGDPRRVDRIAECLTNITLIADNREFRLINGYYNGLLITVCSTGIGSPSAIIALEELKQCGAKKIIRVGSAGALQSNIALGDVIIAEAAVRDEGGSQSYVSSSFPAYANFTLVSHLNKYCNKLSHPYHQGIVRSHDSFYIDDEEEICLYWSKRGVLGADMETSALLTLGRLRGVEVASILTNVVLYKQDVKDGINDYVSANDIMTSGEQFSIQAALFALTQ